MIVTGNNLTIYAGDGLNVIGCEDSCIVTVTAEEIITTTKGSGRGTNREYGRYDATLSSTGVIFIYASEFDAASAGRQDPTFFHSHIIQGKKVVAQYKITDGTITKYVSATWMVKSVSFTGNTGEFATYNVELALDGKLTESTNMTSVYSFIPPEVLSITVFIDEFRVDAPGEMTSAETTYTNALMSSTVTPIVFADGVKIPIISGSGRYYTYDGGTKTITFIPGVYPDEIISIYN